MQCETCGTWTGPGYDNDVCPGCGNPPYRSQPNGVNGEMEQRNMVEPGVGDMGGNPLQEGVWAGIDGGWQNRMKRDESFASVRHAQEEYGQQDFGPGAWAIPHPEVGFHGAPRGTIAKISQDLQRTGREPLTINGRPINDVDDMDHVPYGFSGQVHVGHSVPKAVNLAKHAIEKGFGFAWDAMRSEDPAEKEWALAIANGQDIPSPREQRYQQQQQQEPPPVQGPPDSGSVQSKLYMSFDHDCSRIAQDFEIHRVIEPGPHTVETDGGIVMQGDNPDALDEAKDILDNEHMMPVAHVKQAFLPALMAAGAGMLARPLVGTLMRGALMRGMMGGGQTAQPAQQVQQPPQDSTPVEYLSFHQEITGAYDHPSTDDNFTERASGDPEDVDPHEFNDGEDQGLFDTQSEAGGSQGFTPEVEQAVEEAMPQLLQYYHSEESGEQDPAIQKLLDVLQQYDPELLDEQASPEDAEKHIPKISVVQPMGPGMMAAPGTQTLQPAGPGNAVAPATQASCPHCGARITPGMGVCPQCGGAAATVPQPNAVPQPPAQVGPPGQVPVTAREQNIPVPLGTPCRFCEQPAVTIRNGSYLCSPHLTQSDLGRAAATQGPHSIEQIQAVAQYLTEQGRDAEIPNLIAHPELYGDELAQVANRQQPPDADPDPGAPPPMPDPTQMGMPPGAMPQGAPPGGGMPMMGHVQAADNIAPRCPNCGSGTTETLVSDIDPGNFRCHRCLHTWKKDTVLPTKAGADEMGMQTEGVPAADQDEPYDPSSDQGMGQWTDSAGTPLTVGQQYEMHSQKYDVPDIIRITALKPDSMEYILTGEYGLEHRTEVTRQEAEMDGLSFSPVDSGDDMEQPGLQDGSQAAPDGPAFDPQMTLSAQISPEEMRQKRLDLHQRRQLEQGEQPRESEPAPVGMGAERGNHTWSPGGKGHIVYDQGNFYSWPVPETENPTEMMSYGHTPYMMNTFGVDLSKSQQLPYQQRLRTGDITPEGEVTWHGVDHGNQEHGSLMGKLQRFDPSLRAAQPRQYAPQEGLDDVWAKVAGKKYTPMEQREFIDEPGVARNADLLDLSNTHYEEHDHAASIDDYFLW